jgi:hypothetical protein
MHFDTCAPVSRWEWDIPIDFGNEIGLAGSVHMAIRPSGSFTTWGQVSLSQSQWSDSNVTVVTAVVDCWNRLYSLPNHISHLAGKFGSGPSADSWPVDSTLDELQDNWRDLSPGAWPIARGSARLDAVNLTNAILGGLGLGLGTALSVAGLFHK